MYKLFVIVALIIIIAILLSGCAQGIPCATDLTDPDSCAGWIFDFAVYPALN